MMSCFHPLTRVVYPVDANINPDTGKYNGFVTSWVPLEMRRPDLQYTDIPCGKCRGCRLDYAREWANRMFLEAALSPDDSCWFVTLTYDDEHIPFSESGNPTLVKRDVQLYLKRLRRAHESDRVRFFAAGEYGDTSFRPHYHMIVFGLHLDDLQFYRLSRHGYPLYNSASLSKCWTDSSGCPKGFVVVSPASWETMSYTARYTLKKLKGNDGLLYDELGILPPFSLMSRRPGIGGDAYSPGLFDQEYIYIAGRKITPPKYLKSLYERFDPADYEDYAADRKERANVRTVTLIKSLNKPYLEYLKDCEYNFSHRTETLDRRDLNVDL